jgi:tetratricopeptide (TPR) repeat protein
MDPNYASTKTLITLILNSQKLNEKEIEECADNVDELYEKAMLKRLEGQYKEALELYTQAMKLEKAGSNDTKWVAEFNNQIGICYFELKM